MQCQTELDEIICVDKIVRNGVLAGLEDDNRYVEASRELVEKAGSDKGGDNVVMQTAGEKSCDGFLWAVKR